MNARQTVLATGLFTLLVGVPIGMQAQLGADSAGAALAAPAFDVDRLQISPEVLRRLARSLQVEDSLVRAADLLASPAYRDRYQRCTDALFAGDPEIRRLSERLRAEAAEFGERTRGNASAGEYADFQANVLEVYSLEIEARKETKCGAAPHLSGSEVAVQAARAGRFTPLQLRRLKERVIRFCGGATAPAHAYTPAEAQALRPRCESLLARLEPTH